MLHRCIDDSAVFEPEAISALALAFDQVCGALGIGAHEVRSREAIAIRIIELGRDGLLDTGALRERVLLESRRAA